MPALPWVRAKVQLNTMDGQRIESPERQLEWPSDGNNARAKIALYLYIFSFNINITLLDFRTLHEMCTNLSSFCLLHQAKMEILGFRILEERKITEQWKNTEMTSLKSWYVLFSPSTDKYQARRFYVLLQNEN